MTLRLRALYEFLNCIYMHGHVYSSFSELLPLVEICFESLRMSVGVGLEVVPRRFFHVDKIGFLERNSEEVRHRARVKSCEWRGKRKLSRTDCRLCHYRPNQVSTSGHSFPVEQFQSADCSVA